MGITIPITSQSTTMKILFLIFHGFSEHSGISKKMRYQIKGLRELGHQVEVCTYDFDEQGNRVRRINEEGIQNFGKGKLAALKGRTDFDKVIQYAIDNKMEFVYVRSFHNANPFTIQLFRKLKDAGIKIAMEIPTYPYDQEYEGFPFLTRMGLKIDQHYRHQLAALTDGIVTFTDEETIFGQQTIRISNGVDFDHIPLRYPTKKETNNQEIHLIGVAEVHYWHGFDRLIAGLGEYYKTGKPIIKIHFHIVGGVADSEMYNSIHAPGFKELIDEYGIAEYIHFHGPMYGQELDELFNMCDFAIGSLGRHRSGIDKIKTLKNREYAARGIPFIYSETDEDFDHMPYILKAPADESPIDIEYLLKFYQEQPCSPLEIRNSIGFLSWKNQMQKVLDSV